MLHGAQIIVQGLIQLTDLLNLQSILLMRDQFACRAIDLWHANADGRHLNKIIRCHTEIYQYTGRIQYGQEILRLRDPLGIDRNRLRGLQIFHIRRKVRVLQILIWLELFRRGLIMIKG